MCPRLLPLLPMASWKVRAFSLCMVFTSSRLSRVVPHGMKGTSPEFVTRPVYSRSQLQEQHEHYCCSSSTDAFISYYIYTVHRYRTSPGAPGWADSKAVHGMECNGGAHALLEVSLSRGSCLMCTVLPVQEGVLSHTTEC